ncbi:MAG TPA: hypothetical protein VGL56_00425 [Fimbriimonadaceae bacterium]|jgi:hypothetical protein
MHVSVVSIFGNHLSEIPALFSDLGYEVELPPKLLRKDELTSLRLLGTGELHERIVYRAHSWTYIVDLDLELMFDHEFWKTWSAKLHTSIVGWIAESDKVGYGFNVFYNGNLAREVLRHGNTLEEFGERLPIEYSIQWSNAREDQVLQTVSRIGAHYEYLKEDCEYFLYSMRDTDKGSVPVLQ